MNFSRLASSAVLLATTSLASPADAAPVFPEVHDAMSRFIAAQEISGAVTLVVTPDKIVHFDAQGFADIEKQTPMKEDAVFWIASMTKPVTAVAIMMLVEEGTISLDDPASKYVPELGTMKNADGSPAKTITIRHLLTHTAGLPENPIDPARVAKTLQGYIKAFAEKPMSFEPGTKWAYSQSGINSLGRTIEIVSGKNYDDFVTERLFRPLGMIDTTFFPSAELQQRLATSYKLENGKLTATDIFPFKGLDLASHDRIPFSNGGLFSTAHNYSRFMQMLLNEGTLDGRQYLRPETVKLMATVQTGDLNTGFIDGNAWGLGVCIVREPSDVSAALSAGSYGHGGAYGTQAWIDPVKKVGYLLMVQRANFPSSDASDVRKAFQNAAAKALK
jgi:CubicO group peptidase (beta-lactamase class C family)